MSITSFNAHRLAGAGLSLAAVATIGLGLVAAPASAADDLNPCDGTFTGGTYNSVTVPAGATCTLVGVTVVNDVNVGAGGSALNVTAGSTTGNVTANNGPSTIRVTDSTVQVIQLGGTGSSLYTTNATVNTNVLAQGAPYNVFMHDTTVRGDINVSGATHRITIGDKGCTIDPVVGGNVNLQRNDAAIAICQLTVGELKVNNNSKTIGIFGNTIRHNLNVHRNTGPYIRLRSNVVKGGITYNGNTISGEGAPGHPAANIQFDNTAHSFFNCGGNIGLFRTRDNRLGGSPLTTGECANNS